MFKEQYLKQINNCCQKGKHKLRTNQYGVTWCVRCGLLSNSTNEPLLKEEEKIIVQGV
jgi:hypothetical protein